MKPLDGIGIEKFLYEYPGMALRPRRNKNIIIQGTFSFRGTPLAGVEICDSYELELKIPDSFPKEIPLVKELKGKIPRDGTFHVNPDETLCLGSPLSIRIRLAQDPTLPGFASKCIVPFLYAVSKRLSDGGDFVFSELRHGNLGVIDDYLSIFKLKRPEDVKKTLKALATKRRVANKQPCPCHCGRRLGRCRYRCTVNKFRSLAPRSWFAIQEQSLRSN